MEDIKGSKGASGDGWDPPVSTWNLHPAIIPNERFKNLYTDSRFKLAAACDTNKL